MPNAFDRKRFFVIGTANSGARGLLGWSQTDLAGASGRSLPTIKRLERDDGDGPFVSDDVREAVQRALEKAGVEFIPENGGSAGVRLAKLVKCAK